MITILTETSNIIERSNSFVSKNILWFVIGISILAITATIIAAGNKKKKRKK